MRGAQQAGAKILLIALAMVGVGLVMVYSSSSVLARVRFGDSSFFLERQLISALVGIGLMTFASRIPLQWWMRLARPLLLVSLAFLVLVLVLGEGPARRWLRVPSLVPGFSFQPSEFARLVLVIYLADALARKKREIGDFRRGLLPCLAVIGLVLGLIALQPNLGTSIAVGLIAFVVLWLGGARFAHLAGAALSSVPLVVLSLVKSPYQQERLASFLERWLQPGSEGKSYQVMQSLVALGSGGWMGVGLGNSLQKQQFLPEPHTDFVFALIGEELGLAGTLGVVSCFVVFAVQGVRIARASSTYFGFLLASGITVMISVYALLNIGVATGVLPTTGLPLPFISYGGSSLLWNLGGVGILIGVARAEEGKRADPWEEGWRNGSLVRVGR